MAKSWWKGLGGLGKCIKGLVGRVWRLEGGFGGGLEIGDGVGEELLEGLGRYLGARWTCSEA